MPQEKGWKPLPDLLKVLFVILLIFAISIFYSAGFNYRTNYPSLMLGMPIYGITAAIYIGLYAAGTIVLLIALWNRYDWAWKYGAAYFAYSILDRLLVLTNMPMIAEQIISQFPSTLLGIQPTYAFLIIGTFFGVLLDAFLLTVLYKERNYFK